VRAALLVAPRRIELGDVAEPEVGPDEVRITVGGVGLCGSDVSVFTGKWPSPRYPWIGGHEAFGIVESVGDRISASRIGETVVIEPNVPCGRCTQCLRGRTSACQDRRSLGMNRPGAMAEMVVVPSENAWRVTPTDPEHLVCLEPLTVAEAALRRHPRPMPEAALVVGVGVQGLVMCLALLRRGVDTFVTDVNPDRVAFATELGAQALDMVGADRRFDLIVDTAGVPEAIGLAVDRVEFGGTIIEISLESQPFELTARAIVRRQLELRGSLTYDHPRDFEASVELLEAKAVLPGRIVTDEYPIEDAQSALEGFPAARGKTWIRVASFDAAGT
jgi:alcohol dehydrogenase/L-iditol 2-dehydrogenase